MNTKIQKPDNIDKHDLIAILGLYDTPKYPKDIGDTTYSRSDIAFHELTGKIQVYITAKTSKGLNDFKKDYPDAVIVESAVLEKPDEWKQLAYPSESLSDDATPLDNYFQARGRDLTGMIEMNRRNKK